VSRSFKLVFCDQCKSQIEAGPEEWAVECPKCFTRLPVPRTRLFEPEPEPPDRSVTTIRRKRSHRVPVILGLLACAAVAAAGFTFFYPSGEKSNWSSLTAKSVEGTASRPAPTLPPMSRGVLVLIRPPGEHDRVSSFRGYTNLPPRTRLTIHLTDGSSHSNRRGQSWYLRLEVSATGEFQGKFDRHESSPPDGLYFLDVTVPFAMLQPPTVRVAMGRNGDKLCGPLVSTHGILKRKIVRCWTVARIVGGRVEQAGKLHIRGSIGIAGGLAMVRTGMGRSDRRFRPASSGAPGLMTNADLHRDAMASYPGLYDQNGEFLSQKILPFEREVYLALSRRFQETPAPEREQFASDVEWIEAADQAEANCIAWVASSFGLDPDLVVGIWHKVGH